MLNVTLSVEQPDTSRRRLAGADDSRTTLRVASDVEFSGEIMAGSITERFGSIDIGILILSILHVYMAFMLSCSMVRMRLLI